MGVSKLDRRQVHVWFVELASKIASLEDCRQRLSVDEQERASQFRYEHSRTCFIQRRGILRALLERYIAVEPRILRFAYGPQGKPALAFPESPAGGALEFSMASSGHLAVYAFAIGCEVGVDIEEMRPVRDQEGIVRRFFAREEREDWLTLDTSLRNEAFLRCWTAKEAYIKALGDGLSRPLDSFRVSLQPELPASLIHVNGDTEAANKWLLCTLSPSSEYVGALALPDRTRTVSILPRVSSSDVLELGN